MVRRRASGVDGGLVLSPSRDPAFRLDVAIIGAQKAATSTLFERLRQHPDVSGCRPKEPHHFVKDDWQETLPRYASLFPRPGERLTLEASTTYSFAHESDIVAERLHAHNPKLRVIYVVREPVARIVSAYRHSAERGWAPPTLEGALERWPRLLDNTRYASRLRPFRERFDEASILVLTFDEIVRHQDRAATRAVRFLGLPPHRGSETAANLSSVTKRHHAHDDNRFLRAFARLAPRTYKRLAKPPTEADATLSEETASAIRRELAPEIEQIERWTGYDLAAWRA